MKVLIWGAFIGAVVYHESEEDQADDDHKCDLEDGPKNIIPCFNSMSRAFLIAILTRSLKLGEEGWKQIHS